MLALDILRHTPPVVFALLAYLVWQGGRALQPRTQPLWRIALAPLAFALSGLTLMLTGALSTVALATWSLALLAAVPLGLGTGPRLIGIDPAGRLSLAGSPVPLLRNLTIFALQYGIAVAAALHTVPPEPLAIARTAVSGASLGYCAGWLATLHRASGRLKERGASRPAPAAP